METVSVALSDVHVLPSRDSASLHGVLHISITAHISINSHASNEPHRCFCSWHAAAHETQ
eukprot:582316-Rhodomonas_salina.1